MAFLLWLKIHVTGSNILLFNDQGREGNRADTILSDERYYDVNAENEPSSLPSSGAVKKIKNLRTCKIFNLKKTSNEKFGNGAVKQKSLFTLLT